MKFILIRQQADPIAVSTEMYKKYAARIAKEYKDNPELLNK